MPDRMPHRILEWQKICQIEFRCIPDRMPDRMTTASVLEYMSERVPEAKVLSSRLSGDCPKQSHAIHVKLKCEGSKHAARIETWPDNSWFGEGMADSTSQLKRKQRTPGTDPMMQQARNDFDVGSLHWLSSVCFRCAVQHLHDSSHSMLIIYFNDVPS